MGGAKLRPTGAANPLSAPIRTKRVILKPTSQFDPRRAAKTLLREARAGALATLTADSGDPFCSLVNVASAADGAPLLLISSLALHTKNILADARVSLMLDERKSGDPLQGARIMLRGTAAATSDLAHRRRYLARQPDADVYADFNDFAFYRVAVRSAHLVAGFGRIVDLAPEEVLIDIAAAAPLLDAEAEICVHMNEDHAGTLRLYATRLLGAREAPWRCAGCDPEGLELQDGRMALRLPFSQSIQSPALLRQELKRLADAARAAAR